MARWAVSVLTGAALLYTAQVKAQEPQESSLNGRRTLEPKGPGAAVAKSAGGPLKRAAPCARCARAAAASASALAWMASSERRGSMWTARLQRRAPLGPTCARRRSLLRKSTPHVGQLVPESWWKPCLRYTWRAAWCWHRREYVEKVAPQCPQSHSSCSSCCGWRCEGAGREDLPTLLTKSESIFRHWCG